MKCVSRSRAAHTFRHGGRVTAGCPTSSSASAQQEHGTPSTAMPRRSSGNLTCMFLPIYGDRARACRPAGVGWMGLLHRTDSYSGRTVWPPKRPSLSPCYKSWSHTALTMAASEMPLSIRWMCTPLPIPTICIILSVLFVHNRKAAPHYARSCFFLQLSLSSGGFAMGYVTKKAAQRFEERKPPYTFESQRSIRLTGPACPSSEKNSSTMQNTPSESQTM